MSIVEVPFEGGFGGFRCFAVVPDGRNRLKLRALVSAYTWEEGVQAAECGLYRSAGEHTAEPLDSPDFDVDPPRPDRIAVPRCTCGFWSFKNYSRLLSLADSDGSVVLGLLRQFGNVVEHEYGLRSEYAEIVAILDPPSWPGSEDGLQREALTESYPGISVAPLSELGRIIEDRQLTMLERTYPEPMVQFLTADGKLVWARETFGPGIEGLYDDRGGAGGAILLPLATQYPAATKTVTVEMPSGPVQHRLVKESHRSASGVTYVFWRQAEEESAFRAFYQLLEGGVDMSAHVAPH